MDTTILHKYITYLLMQSCNYFINANHVLVTPKNNINYLIVCNMLLCLRHKQHQNVCSSTVVDYFTKHIKNDSTSDCIQCINRRIRSVSVPGEGGNYSPEPNPSIG